MRNFIIEQRKIHDHQININTIHKYQWQKFIKQTIIQFYFDEITKKYKNQDIHVVLFMSPNPLEEYKFKEYKQLFKLNNSRSKIYWVPNNKFEVQSYLNFAVEIQNKLCTDKQEHILCFYENYLFDEKYEPTYEYANFITSQIIQEMYFSYEIELEKQFYEFPWSDKPSSVIKQRDYVISYEDYGEEVAAKFNKQLKILKINYFDIQEQIEMFANWVTQMRIQYILKQINEIEVESAIIFFQNFRDYNKELLKTDQLPIDVPIHKMSVRQRFIAQQAENYYFKLSLYIKGLKDLIQKDTIDDLTPEEALYRERIGTEIGKYHQRALKMKGIGKDQFQQMKQEFISVLNEIQGDLKSKKSEQNPSVFSLENQLDIFLQEDLINALNEIQSQYQIVQAFPIIGLGVELKRTNGSMINPYLVKIENIAKINATVDTVSIQMADNKTLRLNAGYYMGMGVGNKQEQIQFYGFKEQKWTQYQPSKQILKDYQQQESFYYKNEQLVEIINAVLPLFGEQDFFMKKLVKTRLFNLLISFNVMKNVDTFFNEAYLSLLANAFVYFLNQDLEQQWVQEYIQKIFFTTKIVYEDRPFFQKFCSRLIEQPRSAMVTYKEGHDTQCQDPIKGILVLFYLVKNGQIDNTQGKIREVLESILQEIINRGFDYGKKLTEFFGIVGYDNNTFSQIKDKILENEIGEIFQFENVNQIEKKVKNILENGNFFDFLKNSKIFIYKQSFSFMNFGKLNFYTTMKNVCKYFVPEEKFSEALLWIWLYHAKKYTTSYERNTAPIQNKIQVVYRAIKNLKINSFTQEQQDIILIDLMKILKNKYLEFMRPLHFYIKPATVEQFANLEFKPSFNNVSNLTLNACLAVNCPFYMKKMKGLNKHIQDCGASVPAFNKSIKNMKHKEPEAIFNTVCRARFLDYDEVEKQRIFFNNQRIQYILQKYKDQFIDVIKQLQIDYIKIN
ncbi:zinc-binding dehydrogenase family protein, putative [Ichthyophthirius multifiliis]|uniref:Zinc-binding dehydrogenase family protein, putative n=1 Tax=Ichthyophthirius multifiliis TaxID=5932 RepID=G0QSC0_ICHMU|nr:zinc-binding dehydrogenase family protein, putative [Ichthyophthirius multifiliis]EGR31867.1 zinc-binding dehydrogenase family protein, putative [Ichthyophthirius multifiliis]|eukprot:XP_004035353.1 zinc-binding dehydrogenase family protein, putative [Ichthyophthirius multifiliis]